MLDVDEGSVAFGPFRLDTSKRVLWRGTDLVSLPPKALDLLVVLVEQRGDVVRKHDLLQRVWPDTFVEEANLSVNVSMLRKELGKQPSGAAYIETVPRRGYRFAAAISGESAARPPRLAVLPFQLLGGATDDAYLGVAMADAVITRLSRIGEIAVRPTSAISAYVDRARDVSEIGRELRVDAVVDGRLQLTGDLVRASVQLVPVEGSATSWAETFDEALTDLLAVQDAVAERVALALVRELSATQRERLSERGTQSVEAYRDYAKGRYFWSRFSGVWMQKAVFCFHEAVEKDPQYAAPHAGLADTSLVLGFSGLLPPREAWSLASTSALRGLELDPNSAESLVALAWVRVFEDWAWQEAEQRLAKARELQPSSAATHQWYALLLQLQGRFAEAEPVIARAAELDPLSPVAAGLRALHEQLAGSPELQMEESQQTVELAPNQFLGYWSLGLAYQRAGRLDEAVTEHRRALELAENAAFMQCVLARSLALAGQPDEARDMLAALTDSEASQYPSAYQQATVHTVLGESERALDLLAEGCEMRDPWVILLKVDPMLDELRSSARFAELLGRVFPS